MSADNDVKDLQWRKSSFSTNGGCVEAAPMGDMVAVRDSKNPDKGIQVYNHHEWRSFLKGVRNGEFDYLIIDPGLEGAK